MRPPRKVVPLTPKDAAHHQARLAAFREENRGLVAAGGEQVVLLGDSLTEALDVRRHFPGFPVVNRGIASDAIDRDGRSLGMLHRLDPELLAPRPSHVFVLAGINDLVDAPDDVAHHLERARALVLGLRARYPAARIRLLTLLPARARYARVNGDVRAFNAGLRDLVRDLSAGAELSAGTVDASGAAIDLVDLHARFVGPDGLLRRRFARRDGLHLRRSAYATYRGAIDDAMGWPTGTLASATRAARRARAVWRDVVARFTLAGR